MDLSFAQVPVTFVAGRHDFFTGSRDVLDAAGRVPHAEVALLPGSHLLPVEHPAEVIALLRSLVARSNPG